MMRTFEEISKIWLDNESYDKDYSYKYELKSATTHLVNFFGTMKCNDIKGLTVEKFVKYEYENLNPNTGKPFSKRLIKEHINIGSRIFEFALDNELIDNIRNPFSKKQRKVPKNAPVTERHPINDTHKWLILNTQHRSQIATLIMLYCGLRRGEIIPLEWSDIDFQNKTISVTKSATRQDGNNFRIKPHTKNGKDRYVPIPDIIIPYLKFEKYKSKSKYIYPQTNGKIHTVTTWKKTWESYQKKLNYYIYCSTTKAKGETPKSFYSPSGIPKIIDTFTAHQLRHTYCTMLYLAGVDILTASKLMGHSSVKVTLEIYTHLDEKYKKINIQKFNNYISHTVTIDNCQQNVI